MSNKPVEKDQKEKIVPTDNEVSQTDEAFIDERMKFVSNYPFYGILLLDLKAMATGPEIPIAAVNYRQLFLNAIDPARIPDEKDEKGNTKPKGVPFWSLSTHGRRTVLAHEILHLVFEHLSVPKNFNRDIANIAMDAVINRILDKDGAFKLDHLPPGVVTPLKSGSHMTGFSVGVAPNAQAFMIENYEQKDWLPIYWDIVKQLEKEGGQQGRSDIAKYVAERAGELTGSTPLAGDVDGGDGGDGGDGKGDKDGDPEFEQAKARFRQKVVAAAEEAKKQQGTLPSDVERMIGELLDGKVHWTTYLRRLIKNEVTRDDFSNKSNSRRAHLGGRGRPSVFPKVESEALGHVFLALDTSGSMSQKDVIEGLSEFASLRQTTPFALHFVSCDAQAYDVKFYDRHEEPDWHTMPIKGGGGTDFRPVFDMIAEKRKSTGIRPALLVYFTDTMGSFPEEAPDYPCIFVTNYKGARAPFGTLVSTVDD